MDRSELMRLMVLNEICDDFENVDQVILPNIAREGAKCGLSIERSEIVDALAGLVKDGLAKAYILTPPCGDPFSREFQGMPPLDVIEEYFETYFYVTKKGMDLQLSGDTWWPFDDEGKLRPDWHLDGPTDFA
jgi:hypothetical protein